MSAPEPVTAALSGIVIAIDGTAGSGKSTTSRGVARTLGLRFLDTGAMYRAVTWEVLRTGTALDDDAAVEALAATVDLESGTDPDAPSITLNGTDVSREIRTDPVTAAVSRVSAIAGVRRLMVEQQRKAIGAGGIVVEGRDITTVVAPDADVKVYLTADSSARAQRRAAELSASDNRDHDAVRADIDRRDRADSSRAVSPLSVADDAVLMDTTDRTLEEVVAAIVELARDRVAVTHGG